MVGELECDVNYIPFEKAEHWHDLARKIRAADHEFVTYSTFQSNSICEWARMTGVPIIGVVHNADLFLKSTSAISILNEKGTQLVLLAPHVAAYLNQRLPTRYIDKTAVIESVYWGSPSTQTIGLDPKNKVRVGIPGGVSFGTRAFEELVKAIALNEAFQQTMYFQVLGGGPDRDKLEKLVMEKGLSQSFIFSKIGKGERVRYRQYVDDLRECDMILPLAPIEFIPYRDHKITSAIPTAIGFGLPLILDRWTARVYQVPAVVTDLSVTAALDSICNITPEALSAGKDEILAHRAKILSRNNNEMTRIIEQVGQECIV